MSIRNVFRDIVFDWLTDTFGLENSGVVVSIKSRAVAHLAKGNIKITVRVMHDAVRVNDKKFVSNDPDFFNSFKNQIDIALRPKEAKDAQCP